MSKLLRPFNPNIERELRHRQFVQSVDSRYVTYERRKAEWKHQHPDATAVEYSVAICRIARECGV